MEYEPCLQDGKSPSIKTFPGPDGSEAWCVAFAAFFINFVMAGLGRMSGIIYVAFIDIYQLDRRQASLPSSVRSSVRNLFGPLVGILGEKYGVRKVTIIGGLIGSISAAACFFVNDIVWVTIIWGAINGIGTSLTTTLPLVTIGQHFEKYRTTASGIAFSGGCIGSFVFPVLMEHLLHKYSLEGTFLLIGAIILNTIPACMLLRKPSWLKQRKNNIQILAMGNSIPHVTNEDDKIDGNVPLHGPTKTNIKNGNSAEIVNGELCNTISKFGCKTNKNITVDVDFLRRNKENFAKVLMNGFVTESSLLTMKGEITFDIILQYSEKLCFDIETYPNNDNVFEFERSDCEIPECEVSKQPNGVQKLCENRHFLRKKSDRKSIMDMNSYAYLCPALEKIATSDVKDILPLFPIEDHEDISKIISEIQNIYVLFTVKKDRKNNSKLSLSAATAATVNSREMNSVEYKRSNTFMVHIKTALRLHRKPMFLLICLCRAVHFITFVPVVTTIVDFAMDKGLQEADGKYVIAILSLGDLMGRLCFGWITDHGFILIQRYMLIFMMVQSAANISLPFMQSKVAVLIGFFIYGLFQGSVFVRHPVLVAKYLESGEQSIGMGTIDFSSGVIGFAIPSYIGYFRDTIGSYDGVFFINGLLGVVVGFLWIFEPFLVKYSKKEENIDRSAV